MNLVIKQILNTIKTQKHRNKYILFILLFLNYNRLKRGIVKLYYYDYFLSIPFLSKRVKPKLKSITENIEKELNVDYTNIQKLPEYSFTIEEISNIADRLKQFDYKGTYYSGTVYHGGEEYKEKLLKIFSKFCWTNPLHPDLFKSIRQMEIDIINMAISLFHGDKNCCGNVTMGGTESILLACKAYRDWGREQKGITNPNIVSYNTVHPAFDKACHYFNIKLIKKPRDYKLINYINSDTICIVGSCPDYSYGLLDDIEELSDYAVEKNIGLHVDCCLGGFVLPFLVQSKQFQYNFDFQLKGVTSISADTHKYGYSLKGSSLLLWRNIEYKHYQHYISIKWNGGIYGTPTTLGSKSGALIAATWTALLLNGREKYQNYSIIIYDNLNDIKTYFKNNIFIDVIGDPKVNVIAFKSDTHDIYKIASEMHKKGWKLSILQNPPAFHLCITHLHTKETCTNFISDLHNSITFVVTSPSVKLEGTLALYGSNSKIENSLFTKNIIDNFITLLSRNKISHIYN